MIRYDTQIAPGQADIDCRGIAARDALPGLRAVRGEMLMLQCRDMTLSRPVRLLHPPFPVYVVPRGNGLFMVGATMIESDATGPITLRSATELMCGLGPASRLCRGRHCGNGQRPAPGLARQSAASLKSRREAAFERAIPARLSDRPGAGRTTGRYAQSVTT